MDITLEHLGPGDTQWLADQHSIHYARAEGFDDTFGALVQEILRGFEAHHDPTCERAFIAWQDGQRLGSVFCVRHDETTAKLRLFLLLPQARGLGLGKRMLTTCMQWAKDQGYRHMQLWTHESHRAACALYAAAGWHCVSSKPVHSFGVDLVEQIWRVQL